MISIRIPTVVQIKSVVLQQFTTVRYEVYMDNNNWCTDVWRNQKSAQVKILKNLVSLCEGRVVLMRNSLYLVEWGWWSWWPSPLRLSQTCTLYQITLNFISWTQFVNFKHFFFLLKCLMWKKYTYWISLILAQIIRFYWSKGQMVERYKGMGESVVIYSSRIWRLLALMALLLILLLLDCQACHHHMHFSSCFGTRYFEIDVEISSYLTSSLYCCSHLVFLLFSPLAGICFRVKWKRPPHPGTGVILPNRKQGWDELELDCRRVNTTLISVLCLTKEGGDGAGRGEHDGPSGADHCLLLMCLRIYW